MRDVQGAACHWNLSLEALPPACDVLVVGCGPAGSACAKQLAQTGLQVVMVDAKTFPRDKTCGDGLVPDTHAALRQLGVLDQVLAQAQVRPNARCVAPSGRFVDVPGELAVIPRRELDAILCQGAVLAGACMAAPVRFVSPLVSETGRVVGATLASNGVLREIRARWLVLASGAGADTLEAIGMCQRRAASSMALRAYVHHPDLAHQLPGMRFVWHAELKGGYGWIFPGPQQVYNIGVGAFPSRGAPQRKNLRAMFADFQRIDPIAARLMTEGKQLGKLAGAPLRCDLDGAQWSRPGVLLAGDAVGATYAFSGEGIGKALETGMACAETLLTQVQWSSAGAATEEESAQDAAVLADHAQRLTGLLPRFQMYRKAASFNQHPWLLNLVIWRAQHSPRIVLALADILAERRLSGSLISWRGLRGLLLGG